MGHPGKPPNVYLPADPSPHRLPPTEHSPASSPSANAPRISPRMPSEGGRGVGLVPLPKFPSRLDRSHPLNRSQTAPPQELSEVDAAQALDSPNHPFERSSSACSPSSAAFKPPSSAAPRPRNPGGSVRPQRTSSGGGALLHMTKIAEDLDHTQSSPRPPGAVPPAAATTASALASSPCPAGGGGRGEGERADERQGGGGGGAGKGASPPRMDSLLKRFENGTQQLGMLLWGDDSSPLADVHPPSPPPSPSPRMLPPVAPRSRAFPSSASIASSSPSTPPHPTASRTSDSRTAIRLRFAGERTQGGAGLLFGGGKGRSNRRTMSVSSDASSCSILTAISVASAPAIPDGSETPLEPGPIGPRHTHTASRISIANSLFDDPMLDAIYNDEDSDEEEEEEGGGEGSDGDGDEEGRWVARGDSIASGRTSSIHLNSGRLGSMRYGEGSEEEWGSEVEREAAKMRALVKQIADRGALEDCLASYAEMRMAVVRGAVKEANVRLAVSAGALEGQAWSAVEPMFKTWLSQAHALALVLVQRERALLAAVFKDIPSFTLSAPNGPAKPSLTRLPSLAAKLPTPAALLGDIVVEAGLLTALFHLRASATVLLQTPPAPEKIFVLLDMYWLLRSTVDNMKDVAPSSLSEAWSLLPARAAEAATKSLAALQSMLEQVPKEPPLAPKRSLGSRLRIPLPGRKKVPEAAGAPSSVAVHPVTSYVVNYLQQFQDRSHAGCYGCILEEALREVEAGASVERETGRLLERVQANMEVKGRACSSELTKAIFLINNLHYLASFAEKQQHPCAPAMHAKLETYCDLFESIALKRILEALGPGDSESIDDNEVIKRLRLFNVAFEELALEQKDWSFTNDDCRRKMRLRLGNTVRTTYAKFLLPHREDLCTMPTYHWAPDGVERLMNKSFLFNS